MKKLVLILVGSLALTACGQVKLELDIDEGFPPPSQEPDFSHPLMPDGCMTWFDGCNECMVKGREIVGCTKKKCEIMEEPECRVMIESTDEVPWETLEVSVGPEKVDCTEVAPMKCLVVDGEYFYDEIADFEFEPGYKYQLKIEKYQQYTPETAPADVSLYSYHLVEVLEKEPAN